MSHGQLAFCALGAVGAILWFYIPTAQEAGHLVAAIGAVLIAAMGGLAVWFVVFSAANWPTA